MKKQLFICLALFILSCNQGVNDPSTGKDPAGTNNTGVAGNQDTSKTYFPVYDFIQSETRYVDSLPVGIRKYTSTGKRMDSSYIDLDEFHRLAALFLSPELKPGAFTTHYRESSFYDQSNRSSTFLYEAIKPAVAITRIDVQSRPDEVYDKIFRVYMERMDKNGDTLFTRKMTWKPGKQLEIIESASTGGVEQGIRRIKVSWNNWEE